MSFCAVFQFTTRLALNKSTTKSISSGIGKCEKWLYNFPGCNCRFTSEGKKLARTFSLHFSRAPRVHSTELHALSTWSCGGMKTVSFPFNYIGETTSLTLPWSGLACNDPIPKRQPAFSYLILCFVDSETCKSELRSIAMAWGFNVQFTRSDLFFWVNELAFASFLMAARKWFMTLVDLRISLFMLISCMLNSNGIDHRTNSIIPEACYADIIESTQNSNPLNRFVGIFVLLLASFERLGNISAYINSFNKPISRVNREQKCL